MGFQARRSWHGNGRAWIEVRGLTGPDGAERARAVLDALRSEPGVTTASLNGPLSRVVVELDGDQVSVSDLCRLVDDAEQRCRQVSGSARAGSLPGDGLLLATRGAMFGVSAAGLAVAVVGRALRLPQAPVVDAVAAFTNYQPWVRRLLEDRIGSGATETVLSLVAIGARVATLSPVSLSVEVAMQGIKAAECRAGARAWGHYEADLARHADQPEAHAPSPTGARTGRVGRAPRQEDGVRAGDRRRPGGRHHAQSPDGVERGGRGRTESHAHLDGVVRGHPGQGLADRHAVLPLRPEGLRRLDKVDTVLIDPRVLCGEQLRVVGSTARPITSFPTRGARRRTWSHSRDYGRAGTRFPAREARRWSRPRTIRWRPPSSPRHGSPVPNWCRSTPGSWATCDPGSTTSGPSPPSMTRPATRPATRHWIKPWRPQ